MAAIARTTHLLLSSHNSVLKQELEQRRQEMTIKINPKAKEMWEKLPVRAKQSIKPKIRRSIMRHLYNEVHETPVYRLINGRQVIVGVSRSHIASLVGMTDGSYGFNYSWKYEKEFAGMIEKSDAGGYIIPEMEVEMAKFTAEAVDAAELAALPNP